VWWADEALLVVDAKHPRCPFHRLVIASEHVPQRLLRRPQELLSGRYGVLIERMAEKGAELLVNAGYRLPADWVGGAGDRKEWSALDESEASPGRLIFHLPPFHSMDHLHLHVLGGPFDNFYRDLAHRKDMP
jgi:hypothetical protein